jgi:lipopolysaccharide transport system permease protein
MTSVTLASAAPTRVDPDATGWRLWLRLVLHLTARQLKLRYRRAALGWVWAVVQPLARLFVLWFVFDRVLDLGIERYPAVLFVGLLTWTWFSAGLTAVTVSATESADLLARPRLPRSVVPAVALGVAFVDVLAAVPALAIVLVATGDVPVTALAVPMVLLVEGAYILGLGCLFSAWHVRLRDTHLLIEVALMLGFYVTPVVYTLDHVPEPWGTVLGWSPVARVVEANRGLLIEGSYTFTVADLVVVVSAIVVLVVGLLVYRRSSPTFLDDL